MGFGVGSLVEDLEFNHLQSMIKGMIDEEMTTPLIKEQDSFYSTLYTNLNSKDKLIIGINIINKENKIIYSDEQWLNGKTFSSHELFSNVLNGKDAYFIDTKLISQETRLKSKYTSLAAFYYNNIINDEHVVIQLLYNISDMRRDIGHVNFMHWIMSVLGIIVLAVMLLVVTFSTTKSLEEMKGSLEIDVRKRTNDLEKSRQFLDKRVKERTQSLELANKKNLENYLKLQKLNMEIEKQNKDLIRRTIELNEVKGQLEDKNVELEAANKEIMDMLKTKTEFMNRVAHDLRTPLTPITLLVPLIKNKVTNTKMRHNLTIVENNTKYLNQLLNELISLIKKQPGKLKNYEKLNMDELIEEVISNEENVIKSHNIKVTKEIAPNLPSIKGIRLSIIEVLQNIITNAVKFMPKGGKLKITAFKKDNFIYVSIKDSGIGMAKNTLSRLFEPFFKADKSRHSQGSGLGLSICKKIIEEHDGEIMVQSEGLGKGTTITFYLPMP